MKKLLLRLSWIPISAFFFLNLIDQVASAANSIAHYLTQDSFRMFLHYETVRDAVTVTFFTFVAGFTAFEFVAFFRPTFGRSRILAHLRYGPLAVTLLSAIVLIVFDLAMIEYSKYQIRSYIFDSGTSITKPDIELHNNYRSWCGNGYSAQENYLYFETAASGIDDEDPNVRARSLLMADDVQDWINGGDTRLRSYVLNACLDNDPIVRNNVDDLLTRSSSSCRLKLAEAR